MRTHHRPRWLMLMLILAGVAVVGHPHQDPCHRLHRCPSDRHTYVCGDTGCCDECPDNQYCLTGMPRVAVSPSPVPTPSASISSQSFTPDAVTVCFTPGGNCTEQIAKVIGEAQHTVLVQAYSFTSAPIEGIARRPHTRCAGAGDPR
jgi:hypothetical protein